MGMTTITMKAKIIRVIFEADESGLFFATSPDLPGLLVAKPSLQAAREHVPTAIEHLYLACDVRVLVTEAEDRHADEGSWIAMPVAIAERELARLNKYGVVGH
jgi:hypothetical protein